LILVINPVVQYTVFEQLKNILIATRTNKLRAAGAVTAVAILSDWDFFLLGALSKLGTIFVIFHFAADKHHSSRHKFNLSIHVSLGLALFCGYEPSFLSPVL